jgi:hypothetical protein
MCAKNKKKQWSAGRRWFKPVILATQEQQSKPAQANSWQDLTLGKKKYQHKRDGIVTQGVDPEFKSQHQKKTQCQWSEVLRCYSWILGSF